MAKGENVLPRRKHSLSHRLLDVVIVLYERVLKAFSNDLYFKVTTEFIQSVDLVFNVESPFGRIKFHCNSSATLVRAKNATKGNQIRLSG